MRIRPAASSDLEAIVEIHNQAIRAGGTGYVVPHSVDGRADWFEGRPESRPILVAEEGGSVVGWVELADYRKGRGALRHTAEIAYFVREDHQRKGIATALVRRCIEIAPELEIRNLVAIVLEDNLPSVSLLEKLSFARWGHLPAVAELNGIEVGHLYYGLRVFDGGDGAITP